MGSTVSEAGDQSRLRQLNERAVLAAVRAAGELRVAEIVERSGLGRTAVEEVLASLVSRQWLAETSPAARSQEGGPAARGRGRPARSYRFRAEAGYLAGLDIGANSVRGVLIDLAGSVCATGRRTVTPETSRRQRLAAADRVIADCARDAGVAADSLWAIGAGTTGLVDATGTVVRANAIPDWAGTNLTRHFSRGRSAADDNQSAGHLARGRSVADDNQLAGRVARGRLVAVDNDSQLAALAEQRSGGAAASDMVVLHAGRRTGLALVLDGQLRRGAHGAAADMSALPTVAWEVAIEHLHNAVPSDIPVADRAEHAFAAARAGDRTAQAAVRRYTRAMAVAAATAIAVVDPQLLMLSGTFSQAADVLMEPLAAELDRLCPRVPELRASSLGDLCVAIGAAYLALDALDDRLLAPTRGSLPELTAASI